MKFWRNVFIVACLSIFSLGTQAQLNTDKVLSVGRSALYFQDYILAIQYFNQVIRVKPYLVESYYYRAAAKINLEDYVGAETDLNRALELNPFAPQAYYARCFTRLQLSRWEEAEKDINQALYYSPENPTYLMMRLEIYDHDKRYDDALKDLDFLIRKTNNPDLQLEKGRLLLMKEDTVGALRHFEDNVLRDSSNIEAWGALGFTRLLAGQMDEALVAYDHTIAMHTSNPQHFVNRGLLRYRKNDYRGALADFDKAVKLAPKSKQALFNRALIRFEIGDYNKAVDDLNVIINEDPEAYDALFQRAMVQQKCGNNMEALQDFSAVLKRYPTFIPALYGRAEAYESMGRRQLGYRDMQLAFNLSEERKKKGKSVYDDEPDTEMHVAEADSKLKARNKLFNATSNAAAPANASYQMESHSIRGNVQNNEVAVATAPNFQVTYYEREHLVGGVVVYDDLIDRYNKKHSNRLPVKLVSKELPLSDALATFHFNAIEQSTKILTEQPDNTLLLMERAIDYALVQDFENAIADLSKVLLNSDDALAYFIRANVRCKLVEYRKNTESSSLETLAYDSEMIMRDLNKAISLAPNFAYAYFNRANILAERGNYQHALRDFNEAIRLKPGMAEAYLNRGLIYIYLNEVQKGIEDLGKAGELGIGEAYALLKKMR